MFLRSSIQRIVCCVRSKKERRRAGTDSYCMCCSLLPHPVAWRYIIYPVPCPVIRAPFTQNSEAFTTTWLERRRFVSRSLSLSLVTAVLCPWCWLRENTTNGSLSIAHFVAGCVSVRSPSPYRPHYSGSPVQKARQCRLCNNGELFSERHWKLCWEPRAASVWMAAIGVCPATHDFITHP